MSVSLAASLSAGSGGALVLGAAISVCFSSFLPSRLRSFIATLAASSFSTGVVLSLASSFALYKNERSTTLAAVFISVLVVVIYGLLRTLINRGLARKGAGFLRFANASCEVAQREAYFATYAVFDHFKKLGVVQSLPSPSLLAFFANEWRLARFEQGELLVGGSGNGNGGGNGSGGGGSSNDSNNSVLMPDFFFRIGNGEAQSQQQQQLSQQPQQRERLRFADDLGDSESQEKNYRSHQDDHPSALAVILDGQVAVGCMDGSSSSGAASSNRDVRGRGGVIGDLAIVAGTPVPSHEVIALSPTVRVACINRRHFQNCFKNVVLLQKRYREVRNMLMMYIPEILPTQVSKILPYVRRKRFAAGQTIYSEINEKTPLHFILGGTVQVRYSATAPPTQQDFGLFPSVLPNTSIEASAVALTTCILFTLDRDALHPKRSGATSPTNSATRCLRQRRAPPSVYSIFSSPFSGGSSVFSSPSSLLSFGSTRSSGGSSITCCNDDDAPLPPLERLFSSGHVRMVEMMTVVDSLPCTPRADLTIVTPSNQQQQQQHQHPNHHNNRVGAAPPAPSSATGTSSCFLPLASPTLNSPGGLVTSPLSPTFVFGHSAPNPPNSVTSLLERMKNEKALLSGDLVPHQDSKGTFAAGVDPKRDYVETEKDRQIRREVEEIGRMESDVARKQASHSDDDEEIDLRTAERRKSEDRADPGSRTASFFGSLEGPVADGDTEANGSVGVWKQTGAAAAAGGGGAGGGLRNELRVDVHQVFKNERLDSPFSHNYLSNTNNNNNYEHSPALPPSASASDSPHSSYASFPPAPHFPSSPPPGNGNSSPRPININIRSSQHRPPPLSGSPVPHMLAAWRAKKELGGGGGGGGGGGSLYGSSTSLAMTAWEEDLAIASEDGEIFDAIMNPQNVQDFFEKEALSNIATAYDAANDKKTIVWILISLIMDVFPVNVLLGLWSIRSSHVPLAYFIGLIALNICLAACTTHTLRSQRFSFSKIFALVVALWLVGIGASVIGAAILNSDNLDDRKTFVFRTVFTVISLKVVIDSVSSVAFKESHAFSQLAGIVGLLAAFICEAASPALS